MSRFRGNDRIDLHRIFLRVQQQMLANLAASKAFWHSSASGAASERHWIELFNRYLPQRFRASSAFVIDADGHRGGQIDIAIYDQFYSPRLFHDDTQPYLPAESVYAVFEVKQSFAQLMVRDAAHKAASVRKLRRTSVAFPSAGQMAPAKPLSPILAGILTLDEARPDRDPRQMAAVLGRLRAEERLDLGCFLGWRAFELTTGGNLEVSPPQEALIFFMLRLIGRLQQMAIPALDLGAYARWTGKGLDEAGAPLP